METIDNSRDYMYIFKEQFDYLDILSDAQFTHLFRMIRDLRFNGIDTNPKDIEDLMLRGIWTSMRSQVLTSARNARKYRKRQERTNETPTAVQPQDEETDNMTGIPSVEEIQVKFFLMNFKEYKKETERFISVFGEDRYSPSKWNQIIKSWTPESREELLPLGAIKFIRSVYKRAVANGDKEISKILQLRLIRNDYGQVTIGCPQDCVAFWERNITPTELKMFSKNTQEAQVKYSVC